MPFADELLGDHAARMLVDAIAAATPATAGRRCVPRPEISIRVLLGHDPDRALGIVATWTAAPDEHVRRLASEGTRPFLPWARRVPALLTRPEQTLAIITALHRDESAYVRRSVANHLNDLSRGHAGLVVETAAAWLADPGEHTPRLVRHGLRTLIKQGHPGALAPLGFGPASVQVTGPVTDRALIPYGGELTFTATVENTGTASATLAIDYVVHHRKANGRRHSFRPITTRRYHPGVHAVELQVNGVRSGRADFTLGEPGQ